MAEEEGDLNILIKNKLGFSPDQKLENYRVPDPGANYN